MVRWWRSPDSAKDRNGQHFGSPRLPGEAWLAPALARERRCCGPGADYADTNFVMTPYPIVR